VKVLLDENFPLPLLGVLRQAGIDADHIISLGLRGIADQRIREMLRTEPLLFLTQDAEFLEAASPSMAHVVVSRVRQSRPLAERISLWLGAIEALGRVETAERLFELTDDGQLIPWHGVRDRRPGSH
jgi:hypothetical protein